VNGALLDHLHSLDWCSRGERATVKKLREADAALVTAPAGAKRARHAGIGQEQARQATAA